MDYSDQYDKLYRYCYFKTRDAALAEDVTQEAFLRLWEREQGGAKGENLAFLYTVARNLMIDEFRRKKPDSLPEFPEQTQEGPEEQILRTLAVRRALKRLEEGERELLLLRYVNGVPMAALMKLFGQSRFAIYRRLLKTREKLKQILKEEGIE